MTGLVPYFALGIFAFVLGDAVVRPWLMPRILRRSEPAPVAIDWAMQEALEEVDRIGYLAPTVAPPRPQPRGFEIQMGLAIQNAWLSNEVELARQMANAAPGRFAEVNAETSELGSYVLQAQLDWLAETYSRHARGVRS